MKELYFDPFVCLKLNKQYNFKHMDIRRLLDAVNVKCPHCLNRLNPQEYKTIRWFHKKLCTTCLQREQFRIAFELSEIVLMLIVINYIFIWNEIRGPGHLDAINDIIRKLTINDLTSIKHKNIKEHLIEYDFTYYYIVEYLSRILEKYTVNGNIDMISYINNVFFKNIDIWGFVMIYIAMFEHLYDNFNTLNEYQMQFILKIKYIIIHFLFESPTEPISVTELVKELTSLNNIIVKLEINHASTRLAYLKANRVPIDTLSYQNIRRTKHTKRNKNNKNNRNYRNKTVKNKR
jgi:hypothetical protein